MDIIYLSYQLWSSMTQRAHHIASGLSKYARVLYVEPPTNFLYFARNKKRSEQPGTLRKEGDGELYIMSAQHTLPMKNYFSFLNKYYQNMLSGEIQKNLEKTNFKDPILWFTFPLQLPHFGKYEEVFTLYECMDEYAELEKTYNSALIEDCEKKLLENVNMVVATAKNLEETKGKFNKNIILSPNAADVDFFSRVVFDRNIEKVKIFDNNNPVIGYIGAIREWLDWNLIKDLVETKTGWNFLFVGPVQYNVEEIKKNKNVHFAGQVNYKNLLPYLKAMDVTMVPFAINRLIDNTNPIKIYEYLAAGKPVVTTPFNESFRFGKHVKPAKDVNGFVDIIRYELTHKSQNVIDERVAFAALNSWEVRIDEIIKNIESARKN